MVVQVCCCYNVKHYAKYILELHLHIIWALLKCTGELSTMLRIATTNHLKNTLGEGTTVQACNTISVNNIYWNFRRCLVSPAWSEWTTNCCLAFIFLHFTHTESHNLVFCHFWVHLNLIWDRLVIHRVSLRGDGALVSVAASLCGWGW